MEIHTEKKENTVTISLVGDFDFKARTQFRNTFVNISPESSFILNFAGVEHIDSSGLGLLLMLREHAGVTEANITIVNCNAVVRKALQLFEFDKLFKIR
ncbi:MAG: STAS domain-containing protein [Magnetococcales bacterium]|nr:STAS domain-containing protein [Magnetococcales bacterium]